MARKIGDLKTRTVSSAKAKKVKGGARAGAKARPSRPVSARTSAARKRP